MIKACECGRQLITSRLVLRTDEASTVGGHVLINTPFKPGQHISPETEIKVGSKPHNFKGYSITVPRKDGKPYRLIYAPNHPHASAKGYVREHRLVMEEQLGRHLTPDEVVHHISPDDTLNNSPDNLQVMKKVEHDRQNVALNIHRRWYA